MGNYADSTHCQENYRGNIREIRHEILVKCRDLVGNRAGIEEIVRGNLLIGFRYQIRSCRHACLVQRPANSEEKRHETVYFKENREFFEKNPINYTLE